MTNCIKIDFAKIYELGAIFNSELFQYINTGCFQKQKAVCIFAWKHEFNILFLLLNCYN